MRRLALVGSIAVLAPVAGSAQAHNGYAPQKASWLNQCTVGAFQACASFSISLRYDPFSAGELSLRPGQLVPEGFTRVTLGISNLQGLGIGLPDSGGWMFRDMTVMGMQTTWTTATDQFWFEMEEKPFRSDGSITRESAADWDPGSGGAPVSSFTGWEALVRHKDDPRSHLPGENFLWAGTPYTALWGIAGCDPMPFTGETVWYRGCGATAFVSYDLPGNWTLTENTRVSWSGWPLVDGNFLGCTTGVDCARVTVPEPSSALLLASGLLGLAFVGSRRRKHLA